MVGRISIAVALGACGRLGFSGNEFPPDACALQLDAGAARINVNTHRTMVASGERAPLTFAVDSPLALIDADNGELSALSQTGPVTITVGDAHDCVATATLEIGGDTLWYAGGSSMSVPRREVLRSTDGTSWSVAGMLPQMRQYGALVTFRDRLWWFCGSDGIDVRDEIYVSDDGASWSVAGHMPIAASSFGFTVFDDRLWLVGGNNNANRVYRSDDALTWTQVGTLPMNNHGGTLAAVGGQLIYAGGHDSNLYDWLLASPDGASWTQVGTLTSAREYHSAIVLDSRMYIIGGLNGVALADVTSTTDGVTWTPAPALPVGRAFGTVVRFLDQLWSIGGTDLGGLFRGAPDGTWSTVPSTFPIPRQGGSTALFTPPG